MTYRYLPALKGQGLEATFLKVIFTFLITLVLAKAASADGEALISTNSNLQECRNVKKLAIGTQYSVDCFSDFHHYNSKAYVNSYRARSTSVKIATQNMLHPGTDKSAFKDYELVARSLNKFDIVAANELLPVSSRDAKNNEAVLKYLKTVSNSARARKLFRIPGYIKILNELRKLDKSWSLIISPEGDASVPSVAHELIGFYYRAKKVKPISNDHCYEYSTTSRVKHFACYPSLSKDFLGKSHKKVFVRKPFMASFQAGNFDFTLVTSHSRYNAPTSSEDMKNILKPTFGITNYRDLNVTGFTGATYARFAEAKSVLKIMDSLKEYYEEQDVMYLGDMNLNYQNNFWKYLLGFFDDIILTNKTMSTISSQRIDTNGDETEGVASAYDHFLIDTSKSMRECGNSDGKIQSKVTSFYTGVIESYIDKTYGIRGGKASSGSTFDYKLRAGGQAKMDKLLAAYKKKLKSIYTVKRNEIVVDSLHLDERVSKFKRRVLTNQLNDSTYY